MILPMSMRRSNDWANTGSSSNTSQEEEMASSSSISSSSYPHHRHEEEHHHHQDHDDYTTTTTPAKEEDLFSSFLLNNSNTNGENRNVNQNDLSYNKKSNHSLHSASPPTTTTTHRRRKKILASSFSSYYYYPSNLSSSLVSSSSLSTTSNATATIISNIISSTWSTLSELGERAISSRSSSSSVLLQSPPSYSYTHGTVLLPVLVFIDMFAVSLVVPLLVQYYKDAGVTSPSQRELLSSLFSSAQIVGGILMGICTDAQYINRKTILLLSFVGSAIAYLLMVVGTGFTSLIISRLLVGFVKQTMTVTTTLLTHCTTSQNRVYYMGRLSAASTVAWIAGPTIGAMLYQYINPNAPLLVACILFIVNSVLSAMFVEDYIPYQPPREQEDFDDINYDPESNNTIVDDTTMMEIEKSNLIAINPTSSSTITLPDVNNKNTSITNDKTNTISIFSNVRACFNSQVLGIVIIARLIHTWTTRTTNYSQLGSFYEDMYGLQPYHRGYISSYQQLLQFIVQSSFVSIVMNYSGNERQTVVVFSILLVVAVVLELTKSLYLFVVLLCPLISLSSAMTNLSLQTLLTHVAPTHSTFSVLAALDVLQNAVSITVPFYRTMLFYMIPSNAVGDPNPLGWIISCTIHWFITAVILSGLLLSNESIWYETKNMIGRNKHKGR